MSTPPASRPDKETFDLSGMREEHSRPSKHLEPSAKSVHVCVYVCVRVAERPFHLAGELRSRIVREKIGKHWKQLIADFLELLFSLSLNLSPQYLLL